MNPLVFAALAAAVAGVSWRRPVAPGFADEARRLLVSTIAPAAVYFLLHALHDRVQGNWLAPLFPASRRSRRRLGRARALALDGLAASRRHGGAVGGADRARRHGCSASFRR